LRISAEFITSAAGASGFPRDGLVEVALVGRSNVGKSSLINALARRPIARTSAAPGKTRLANFYRVQRGLSAPLYLVDLPGYGYARGGESSTAAFERLTEEYFARGSGPGPGDLTVTVGNGAKSRIPSPGSRVRIGVLLLVDSRHPGLASDLEAWRWLRQQPAAHGIVGTKVDKLTRAERARHGRELDSLFETHVPLVSADTGEGLEALWKLIVTLPKETAA
jgi:GTP-binding protein